MHYKCCAFGACGVRVQIPKHPSPPTNTCSAKYLMPCVWSVDPREWERERRPRVRIRVFEAADTSARLCLSAAGLISYAGAVCNMFFKWVSATSLFPRSDPSTLVDLRCAKCRFSPAIAHVSFLFFCNLHVRLAQNKQRIKLIGRRRPRAGVAARSAILFFRLLLFWACAYKCCAHN